MRPSFLGTRIQITELMTCLGQDHRESVLPECDLP